MTCVLVMNAVVAVLPLRSTPDLSLVQCDCDDAVCEFARRVGAQLAVQLKEALAQRVGQCLRRLQRR